MAIQRTHDVDDDGTGLTGTVRTAAWKEELYDQIDVLAAGKIITLTTVGTVDDWVIPGRTDRTLVKWASNTGNLTVTGMAGGQAGQLITFYNNSYYSFGTTNYLSFAQQSASSAAANRCLNTVISGPTMVGIGGTITYMYDGSFWRLISHEQGAPITAPFAAGNFTGFSGISSSNVIQTYYLKGTNALYTLGISNATAQAVTYLGVTFPYSCAGGLISLPGLVSPSVSGGWGLAMVSAAANSAVMNLNRTDYSNFPTTASATFIGYQIWVPVN